MFTEVSANDLPNRGKPAKYNTGEWASIAAAVKAHPNVWLKLDQTVGTRSMAYAFGKKHGLKVSVKRDNDKFTVFVFYPFYPAP